MAARVFHDLSLYWRGWKALHHLELRNQSIGELREGLQFLLTPLLNLAASKMPTGMVLYMMRRYHSSQGSRLRIDNKAIVRPVATGLDWCERPAPPATYTAASQLFQSGAQISKALAGK